MSHASDDQLLLLAYGDLDHDGRTALEAHLGICAECRGRFAQLEEGRAALDWGLERRPAHRGRRLAWLALPLAAAFGALMLTRRTTPEEKPDFLPWRSHIVASPTAGYVAGGRAFMAIDSQLTLLEQRRLP